jgi:hypothetical protein
MKLLSKLFKKKEKTPKISKRNQKLLDMYERGQVLQIDTDVDNKALMLEKKE